MLKLSLFPNLAFTNFKAVNLIFFCLVAYSIARSLFSQIKIIRFSLLKTLGQALTVIKILELGIFLRILNSKDKKQKNLYSFVDSDK